MIGTKVTIEQTVEGYKMIKESPRGNGKANIANHDLEFVHKFIDVWFDKKRQELADQAIAKENE